MRPDDRGTSLVIVLMIITFVSVVMGVVLAQEGTSVKATDALQDQSATSYGADAAGQAAVTQVKNGQFACTATGTSTLNLGDGLSNPFYRPVGTGSEAQNAVAACAPDTTTGVTTTVTGTQMMVGPANTPTAAITSVGTTAFDGITALNLFTLCVQGSVVSYTTIGGSLAAGANSKGSPTDCPDETSPNVTVRAFTNPVLTPLLPSVTGCGLILQFTQCTPLGGTTPPPVPAVPDPASVPASPSQPVCQTSGGKTYAAFEPGLYTVLTASKTWSLSTPCGSGSKWTTPNVEWFSPGVYYFDFGSTTWTLPATVVGGTPTTASGAPIAGLNPLVASTLSALSQMPTGEGKCLSPSAQTQAGEVGVEFVFGGASTMTGMTPGFLSTASTDLDLCATYSASSPPVAIYGVNKSGLAVSPESGCVASPICILGTKSLLNWPTVFGLPIANQTFHIDGYVWAPAAAMSLSYLGSTGQAFNWGVLARTFQVYGASQALTMAALPAANPGLMTTYTYSIRYLNVWTCAASSSPCPQLGAPNVQIKLQQTATTWRVLSWSEHR
jgi:Tfp pilus assembly protein PilX